MIEIKREVKEGFENEYESLMAKKSTLEVEKQTAIDEAVKKVNEQFAEREKLIGDLLIMISDEVKVEIPESPAEEQPEYPNDCQGEAFEEEGDHSDYPSVPDEESIAPNAGERVDPPQIVL